MKKRLSLFSLLNILTLVAFGQAHRGQVDMSKIPFPLQHYQEEYTFDTTLNPQAWTSQKRGLHVSFATTDELFFRSEVPDLKNENALWLEKGWRGERLNTQVLVWSPDTLHQVHFELKNLKMTSGESISTDHFSVHLVRYVISNYPYGARDATCGVSEYKNAYLMPDRFEEFDRFDLPAKTVRTVWLALDIPSTTRPGTYTGTIEVKCENYSTSLSVKITVQNQLLPSPHEWKHRLDLWQNPWVVAWENHLKPWSEEHKVLLRKHLQLYANAGGTYITTYAVHSPWADNSNMIEGGMIEWIKRKNGDWKFDYSIFDTYVRLAMSVGIDRAITIYTPVPWGFRFRYLDERSGNYIYESWAPDSKEYKAIWDIF